MINPEGITWWCSNITRLYFACGEPMGHIAHPSITFNLSLWLNQVFAFFLGGVFFMNKDVILVIRINLLHINWKCLLLISWYMSFISLERDQKQFKTKTKRNKNNRRNGKKWWTYTHEFIGKIWANIQEETLGWMWTEPKHTSHQPKIVIIVVIVSLFFGSRFTCWR